MFAQALTAVLVPASAALLLASLAQAQPRERSGAEVVAAQCIKCHETGLHGAPKIDDRAAWSQRLKFGVDAAVHSAIKGHGAMPARGGMADLSDAEVRAAILYMFDPARAALKPYAAAPPAAAPDPNHKLVGGVDLYLGIAPAASAAVSQPRPSGAGYYYVNLTLRDVASGAYIKDAQVEARAANAVSGGDTKKLAPTALAESASYGNFFRMQGKEPYVITVQVRRPGAAQSIEARFDFRP